MKYAIITFLASTLTAAAVITPAPAFSQSTTPQSSPTQPTSDPQKAATLKQQAVDLMDNGDPEKALLLLDSAQRLDPGNYVYRYEMGYAYYVKKDYPAAIRLFRQTTTFADITDQCYQMLGNAYDMNNERAKAREAYAEGLRRFPNAGRLYMESGITYLAEKSYDTAAALWEKGVQVEPNYPSNYFRLAKLFAQTDERIWAVLYGELFMNIERGSDRTAEISKLLFDAYKQSIHFSDTSLSVTLDMTSKTILVKSNPDPKDLHLPFRLNYTLALTTGLAPFPLTATKRELSIAAVSNARTLFVDIWFNKLKLAKQFPNNVLLDYQHTINEKGYLEEYNYWLLMKGNEEEFNAWYKDHKEKFDAFIKWYGDNPLQLDKDHLLVRTQYDQ